MRCYKRVALKEPPQIRIVDTPVHVNNTHRVDHLVAGRATGGDAVEPSTAYLYSSGGFECDESIFGLLDIETY